MRVAVVGAGISGLSCATVLQAAGVSVTLFDKGRGPAGRMSTRRAAVPFDHGAQYFTAQQPDFQAEVARLMRDDVVAQWSPHLVAFDRVGAGPRPASDVPRFVGVPGMSAMAQALAAPLQVHANVTVTAVDRVAEGWRLRASAGAAGERALPLLADVLPERFDAVVLTAPPSQTATLLGAHPLAATVETAKMAPCWAVMSSWADAIAAPFDAAFVNEGPLSWVARDGSKPGRPHPHTWVLHASAAWSIAHLEETPDSVLPALMEAFEVLVGRPLPAMAFSAAHRWRYASVVRALETTHLWDPALRVGVAGDWCGGPRVEGAWLSGRTLAQAILAS